MSTPPKPGDWLYLWEMSADPDPLPQGAVGQILEVLDFGDSDGQLQLEVAWLEPHQERLVAVIAPPDSFQLIEQPPLHNGPPWGRPPRDPWRP